MHRRLAIAYRLFSWMVVAACLAVALFLAVMAVARPIEIAESSALLLALAALAVAVACLIAFRPRWGALAVLVGAVAIGLRSAALDPEGTRALIAVLAAVAAVEAWALLWLRPWRRAEPLARRGPRA